MGRSHMDSLRLQLKWQSQLQRSSDQAACRKTPRVGAPRAENHEARSRRLEWSSNFPNNISPSPDHVKQLS